MRAVSTWYEGDIDLNDFAGGDGYVHGFDMTFKKEDDFDIMNEIWKYDAADIEGIGELISTTDRQGNTTRLTYGAASEDVHQFVPLASVTDAAGQSVRVENDGVGRVTAFVHPDGRRWQLAYDKRSRH